jgi:hypothetical protein
VLTKWAEAYDSLQAALLDHNRHYPDDLVSSVEALVQAVTDRAVTSYRRQHAAAVATAPIPSEGPTPSTSDRAAGGVLWDFRELLDYGSGHRRLLGLGDPSSLLRLGFEPATLRLNSHRFEVHHLGKCGRRASSHHPNLGICHVQNSYA